jgi:hypothetical protein
VARTTRKSNSTTAAAKKANGNSTTRKASPAKAASTTSAPAEKKVPEAFQARKGDAAKVAAAKEAQAAVKTAIHKRDEAIIAAVKSGTSPRQLGIELGLTHGAVLKISRA